jgi:hypothetical protein
MAKARVAPAAFEGRALKPETLRGRAGFFRVGQTRDGAWWLVDPHNQPIFLRSVAAVNRHGRAGVIPAHRSAYACVVDRIYGYDDLTVFARGAQHRLRQWHVNALGPWADPVLASDGLYATALVEFIHAGVPVIHAHGTHLPDVFDSGWGAACDLHAAKMTAPWRERRELVGYYTDDALGWGDGNAQRPSLLQLCLSLEPNYAAYHAAWEFVLAPHAGDLAALGRAWSVELPKKETIRQRTLAERPLTTPGYLRDHERFSREYAHRYFTATAAALRRYDPAHLVLGCRFAEPPGAAVLAECVYPKVDILSWHGHAPDFAAHAALYAGNGATPALVTAFGLTNERFRIAPFEPHVGPTRLERMLRDGRRALTAACTHVGIVGYEWARWADEADEIPPFGAGLVHVDDGEAFEHTELFAQINARAERLRRTHFPTT